MIIARGLVTEISGAYDMGLDLPNGEVIVETVTTLEENYSIEADAREQLRIMKEDGYSTSEIEDVEFGQWVVFHYSKYELDKDYFNVVMPIDTFRQLIRIEEETNKMESKMVIETIGAEEIYSIHTIEAGEVIGSESFDNFEECAENLVEVMLENGAEDEAIEEAIVDMLRRDTEDKHTEFILDLLHQHYLYLEEMGR